MKENFNIIQENNKVIDIDYKNDDYLCVLLFNSDNHDPECEYTEESLKTTLKNSILDLVNGKEYNWNNNTFYSNYDNESLVYIFISKYNNFTFVTGKMGDIPHIIHEINNNSKIYLVKLIDESD